ncbi:hypothetical protein EW146_g6283 [Bondarzewia mesenterica]|uniref:FAD-binding PCMH-type domain-containing protein n=1 Tax=Bondarzewia mesenterica TaxID=1095465 RepID=A0A4S4LUR4_9AGAM|nr:hypothetical protein EW146_g6283 [Bondarzewia mesenterica]
MWSCGLISLALASLAAASQKCKCLPGDACFPSQSEWDEFAKNLSQPLITHQRPLASVCYTTSSNYDPSACDAAANIQSDIAAFAASSNTLYYANFEALITNTSVQQCPFDPAPDSVCYQGRVPSYAINVSTVADIQNTVQFASKNNLHLVVKNTGHELMGRAFGVGSVELFTHNLRDVNFSDSFVPLGAPDSTQGQSVITVGAGVQWIDVYRLADEQNRSVAGGFSVRGTVGAGAGWPVGGGHSVLSPYYGLGVDNVLQYTVVLPNASYVTANDYQNIDIFWALRGGGAPSFGVVTSVTYKTHPNLPYTAAFYSATANSSVSYHRLFEVWNQHHNAVADAGWSGPWPFFENSLYMTLVTQGTPPTSASANGTLEAFFSASREIPGVNVSLTMTVPYSSFQSFFYDNLVDSSKGIGLNFSSLSAGGTRTISSSWLLPRELTAPGNASALADIYMQIPIGIPFMVGGGAVATVDPNSTAVPPAWRTTITDMTLSGSYNETANATEIHALWQSIHDQTQPLRELAPIPAGGQYLNEPDILEIDWQSAHWGTNYPRLLSIKQAIDPDDLFIIRHGVNSEQWDEEVVCKTT